MFDTITLHDAIAYALIALAYGPLIFCAVVAIWKGCKEGDDK